MLAVPFILTLLLMPFLLVAAAFAVATHEPDDDGQPMGGRPPPGAAATGSCAGARLDDYRNGRIPLGALCPLWGAPGEHLRADAAHAFESLSRAYQARFGAPVCVTDSYRTYDEQVRLRAQKPSLAAVPGTSNHGWGTALDLCGGIQRFGSAEHQWMRATAGRFGWRHPPWARQGGSKPEPWHWEFTR